MKELPGVLGLFLVFFAFLGLHLQHVGVPSLGVESELHLHNSSWQPWILDPLSEARDQTSWILVGFITC